LVPVKGRERSTIPSIYAQRLLMGHENIDAAAEKNWDAPKCTGGVNVLRRGPKCIRRLKLINSKLFC